MTTDEIAKKAFDSFMKVHYMDLSDEMVMTAITQGLRDQIEECAKIADEADRDYASFDDVAADIRALAADEKQLPTIEEMSGLVEDFTDGVSLKEYMEDLHR